MPIFILLSTLTQQGVQTLKSNPERLREVNKDVEELGCRVLHQWATLGEFDLLNGVAAPHEDPDASRPRDRGVPADARLARRRGGDLAGETRVADDQIAVRAQR